MVDRIVGVKRDRWKIAVGGDILPNSDLEIETDLPYKIRSRLTETVPAITYEYGSMSCGVEILDIDDHNRDFSLPGEVGAIAALSTTFEYGDTREWADAVTISHLMVEDEFRGQGLGKFLFDVFAAVAVHNGGEAAGKVGGGEDTAEFFTSWGVPESDVRITRGVWSPGKAAAFRTDAENLVGPGTPISIQGRDPF